MAASGTAKVGALQPSMVTATCAAGTPAKSATSARMRC